MIVRERRSVTARQLAATPGDLYVVAALTEDDSEWVRVVKSDFVTTVANRFGDNTVDIEIERWVGSTAVRGIYYFGPARRIT